MNKDILFALSLRIVFTIIGEIGLFSVQDRLFPIQGSEEAIFIDDAFFLLTVLSVPIFTLVCVMLGYSFMNFRASKNNIATQATDKQSIKQIIYWKWGWLIGSTVLCLSVLVHPGFTGINELFASEHETPDLTISVIGQQWAWSYQYIDSDNLDDSVTIRGSKETVVLPNNSLIRFHITAPENDVLHSFWIPAFRTKIDVIPGMYTALNINTNRIGNYDEDVNYRVQCAELCGMGHSIMSNKVSVVSKKEFEKWLSQKKK